MSQLKKKQIFRYNIVDFLKLQIGRIDFGLCLYCSQKTILNRYDLIA